MIGDKVALVVLGEDDAWARRTSLVQCRIYRPCKDVQIVGAQRRAWPYSRNRRQIGEREEYAESDWCDALRHLGSSLQIVGQQAPGQVQGERTEVLETYLLDKKQTRRTDSSRRRTGSCRTGRSVSASRGTPALEAAPTREASRTSSSARILRSSRSGRCSGFRGSCRTP